MAEFSINYANLEQYGKDIEENVLKIATNLTNIKKVFGKIAENSLWQGPKGENFISLIDSYWETNNVEQQAILKYIDDYKIRIAGFIEDALNEYKTSDKAIEEGLINNNEQDNDSETTEGVA